MSTVTSEVLVEYGEPDEEGVPGEVAALSPTQLFLRRFRKDKVAVAALGFIIVLIFVAVFAPLIVKVLGIPGPNEQNVNALDEFGQPAGPSAEHIFGVDDLGRDIFARVLYGARVSLLVAFVATGAAVVIGVTVGMVAGFFRGWIDTALSRLMDIVLAFPILLLAIGLASACSLGKGCAGGLIKPGVSVLIVVIALASWPYIGRIIRGQVLSLREKEFIDASRSLGASNRRIVFREILPNLVAPIIVYTHADPAHERPLRGGALVPRRGRAAADGELGADDRRPPRRSSTRRGGTCSSPALPSSSRSSHSTWSATGCRTP